TVTDNSGAIAKDTMQVTVNPAPNVSPTANAGPDQFITLPINTVTLAGTGNDPDGTISAYLWKKIAGPVAGNITNSAAANSTVTALVAGIYNFELTVTDNSGAIAKDTMQVTVFAPNIPPVANAGLNQSMTLPTNIANLTGSGTDIDGTITTYLWSKVSGPAIGIITNANIAVTYVTGLVEGIYVFELKVIDNNGAIVTNRMQVTVNPANIPPIARAGSDQSLLLTSNNYTLTGSGTDIDGSIVSYAWKQLTGPTCKLSAPYSAVTELQNLNAGTYQFELTVFDNKGAWGKDSITLKVTEPAIPSQNNITVYPNPAFNFSTLNINQTNPSATLVLSVTDLQGKTLYKKRLMANAYTIKEKLDMSTFSKGLYLVTVYFNSLNKQTIKVINQ
ncbi:MAG: T9SS type A sorting domain-containing protein, partial [Ferruginibacter sp.]